MLRKYRVGMIHIFKEETGKLTDNYKPCNKCHTGRKEKENTV